MHSNGKTIKENWPLVALVGPTNAGKSTLFNRLTEDYRVITAFEESTTRDRVYGEAAWQKKRFLLVDTGGLVDEAGELEERIRQQMEIAVEEADVILFVFDALVGLTPRLRQFAQKLSRQHPLWLIANKMDSDTSAKERDNYQYLGLPYYELSARSGRNVADLLEDLTKGFSEQEEFSSNQPPNVAIVGRPNVGKSSLLNALLGSDRAVISPTAGTTRDIVASPLTVDDRTFQLVDTAGVNRRGKIGQGVENFSVKRTLSSIRNATAVLVLVDATVGSTRGDLHLAFYAQSLGKPVLIVVNKGDIAKEEVHLHHQLAKFPQVFVSAQEKTNIDQIKDWLAELPA